MAPRPVVGLGPVGFKAAAALLVAVITTGCQDLLGGNDGPLALEWTSPAPEASEVSVLTPVYLGLNRGLGRPLKTGAVTLWDGPREIRAQVSLVAMGRVVVVDPTDPLDFGTRYRVEVSPSFGSLDWRAGDEAGPLEFTTEGLPPPYPDLDSLRSNLQALAHDSMRGRGSGSADELKAAEYLRERFLLYGLQEAPGGAIQGFQAYARRLGSDLTSVNVLAAIPGAGDLAGEWIVVGAHFDHIGFRGLDGEDRGPNNGADDNGSGTVTILEMARILRSHLGAGGFGGAARRSVLFAAFGAEEEGLLGSCSYVHGVPAVPLASTAAMMNFDMVGRLRGNTLFLSGGETSPVWVPLVHNANEPGLDLSVNPQSCSGCTDHACFWQAGVPFVGFFTGLHPQYHLPDDDVHLIDFPGMARVGGLAFRILSRLMVMPDPPVLTGPFPGFT